jgi:hypothetical protein
MTSKQAKTIRLLGSCATAILFVVLMAKWWQYYHSPERIRDLAIQALERRDARALYQITGSDEIKALNLSESKINRLLDDVKPIGNGDGLKTVDYIDWPVDTRLWALSHKHKKHARTVLYIVAIKYKKEGWRINLTNTLYHSYRIENRTGGSALYESNCKSLGVRGILNQHGEVQNFR